MPIPHDATQAALAIGLIFGAAVVCAMFLINRVQKRQQETLTDAVRSLERLLKFEPQLISSVRHLESYRQGLQKIAFQIDSLRDHMNFKHEQFGSALAGISETLSALTPARQKSGESQPESGLSRWRRD